MPTLERTLPSCYSRYAPDISNPALLPDQPAAANLATEPDIDLQTPLRKNMPDGRDPGAVARLIRTRRAVETAIGKLSEMVAAQTTKAFQAS